jgi:hypothetical protein
MIGQSETGSSSQIIFITLFFWQALGFAVPFSIGKKLCNFFAEVKPFC